MILGIDEVGRGSWAGPLVVGAVILGEAKIDGLTDSKKLSKKRREQLDLEIRAKAQGLGLGWVDATILDKIGLSAALSLATKRAVEQIKSPYHEIIIDGTVNFLADTKKGQFVTTLKKADLLIPAVSAASIIAKVARDNFMVQQDAIFPEYNFKNNVGYGTAFHRRAIEKFGVTSLHRLSFAPLQKYQKNSSKVPKNNKITSKSIGDNAENIVADYLTQKGHAILERNWKTPICEVDIISIYQKTIFFTEVRYREKSEQGGGLATITPKKLHQMRLGVKTYVHIKKYHDVDLRLAVASVSGISPRVDDFIELDDANE